MKKDKEGKLNNAVTAGNASASGAFLRRDSGFFTPASSRPPIPTRITPSGSTMGMQNTSFSPKYSSTSIQKENYDSHTTKYIGYI